MKLRVALSAVVLAAVTMACSSVNPVVVQPAGSSEVTFVSATYRPGGRGSALVGRVYVLEGSFEGRSVSYIGATARELRARFSTHQWKELILADTTTITIRNVHADLNVAASGQGTVRSAVNEALRAAEQGVLSRVRRAGGTRVLNVIEAATEENAERWTARHRVRLGRMSTLKGGSVLGVMAGFVLLDMFMMYRDEKTSRFVMTPYLLEDHEGVFVLQHRTSWFFFHEYFKHYLEGDRAGEDVRIGSNEFNELKEEAEALWGYVDPLGNWVPGLLRRSLPNASVDSYDMQARRLAP